MKNIGLTFFIILTSISSFGESQTIRCIEKSGMKHGVFYASLDSSVFQSGSDLADIGRASWSFNFSSAQMICSESYIHLTKKTLLDCAGYLSPSAQSGLIEVSIDLENGSGTGIVQNLNKQNVYFELTDGMELKCRIETQ